MCEMCASDPQPLAVLAPVVPGTVDPVARRFLAGRRRAG